MNAKAGRFILNVILWALFIELLAYRPGSGLYRHALLGCLWFGLLVLHLIINKAWFVSAMKPPYVSVKTLFVTVNVLLFVAVAMLTAGVVGLSGSLVAWSPFTVSHLSRQWHHWGALAAFFMLTIHAGLHCQFLWRQILQRLPAFLSTLLQVLLISVGGYLLVFGTVFAPLLGEPILRRGLALWRYWAECALLMLWGVQMATLLMQVGLRLHLRTLR